MASGNSLAEFKPADNEPPTANYATRDDRNVHPVLDFDPSTDEAAVFSKIMPQNYAGGGVTVHIHFSASGITTGNVVWQGAFELVGANVQDTDSDGFATAQSSSATAVPGTDGKTVTATIAFTNGAQMGSVVAGSHFRFKLNRDADNVGSDTAAADAELHAIEIRET